MRCLFIHQNFPGQFKFWAAELAGRPGMQVAGLGDAANLGKRDARFSYPVLGYPARKPNKSGSHHYLASFETAIRRGQDVVRACQQMRAKGFVPDLIVGHPAWGELLFVKDVFPAARVIAYFEFFYGAEGRDVGFDPEFPLQADARYKLRIRNSTQLQALASCDAGISPTRWQRSTYPTHEQARIQVIHEGLDLDVLKFNPEARFSLPDGRALSREDQVVTYVSRQLEPYRGFHVFMRALPNLQKRLPHAHFVIVGANGVSYGAPPPKPYASYREMLLAEVGSRLDHSRLHFTGRIPYADYIDLLQVSKLHIYLSYPFVLSWSMLEAMACGAPILGSATPPVQEVIRDGENGFLFEFFDREQLVERAVDILQRDVEPVRRTARQDIEASYSCRLHSLPAYQRLLHDVMSSRDPR